MLQSALTIAGRHVIFANLRLLYLGPQREAMPNRAITIMQLLGLTNRVITVSIVGTTLPQA